MGFLKGLGKVGKFGLKTGVKGGLSLALFPFKKAIWLIAGIPVLYIVWKFRGWIKWILLIVAIIFLFRFLKKRKLKKAGMANGATPMSGGQAVQGQPTIVINNDTGGDRKTKYFN